MNNKYFLNRLCRLNNVNENEEDGADGKLCFSVFNITA